MNSLLDRVEATIQSIPVMPVDLGLAKNKELAVLPSRNVPFLIPGAIKDKNNIPSLSRSASAPRCVTWCITRLIGREYRHRSLQ
jgi:hypothetical protein